ncbi:MAG TPA: ATP-binding protein [Gemmatimonadaceae bacterium]|nr:ATP-binding protein [Gemmatimonadaceae bacterium]
MDITPGTDDHSALSEGAPPTAPESAVLPEALYRGIIAISADAIICVDRAQRMILFNQGAERIFGYSADEVIGKPLELLLPARYRTAHGRYLQAFGGSNVAARQMGERGQIFGLRKDGEEFPAEASISRVEVDGNAFYTAVLRDISERRRAEDDRARLMEREREARRTAEAAERRASFLADATEVLDASLDYSTTLQNLADIAVPRIADVCFIDVLEHGSVRRVASAASTPALTDTAQRLHAFPRRSEEPYLTRESMVSGRAVLVREATRRSLERVTQHPDHLRLLLELHPRSYITVPLLARGRTLGAIALIATVESPTYTQVDLSLAEELGRRAALAVDNSRLYGMAQEATRAREEILGIVSHDLRNPLSAIMMCAGALDEGMTSANESLRYMVTAIADSASWMNRLIQDLLDMASIESGRLSLERQPVQAEQILARLEMTFASAAKEAGIALVIGAQPALPPMLVDGERILQVLANLVANSIKFTPAGGEIRVLADPVAGDPTRVVFSVSDTGCGIPPEHLPHVFDRFWQARRGASQRGTGLGLAISRGIVEAHGGTMEVESEVGRGSIFHIWLPAAPETASESAAG